MKWKLKGRGRQPKTGMNKLEADYAAILKARQQAGEILWFTYEGIKFRLADNTFYTPDFAVMMADGTIEIHETKGGFIRDDAMVKLKVAASLYPFRFVMAQRKNKREGWVYKEFGG